MKIIQFLIFIILQIILLSVTFLGVILASYKEMIVSKKLSPSFTAGQVIQSHWMMHYFGVRKEEMTVKLIKPLRIVLWIGTRNTSKRHTFRNDWNLVAFSRSPSQE